MPIRSSRGTQDIEQEIDAIGLFAKDHKDDLATLRNFDFYIRTEVDLIKLKVLCMKYGVMEKITYDTAPHVVGVLTNVIRKELKRYVEASILQRVNEDAPDRVPRNPQQQENAKKNDPWGN